MLCCVATIQFISNTREDHLEKCAKWKNSRIWSLNLYAKIDFVLHDIFKITLILEIFYFFLCRTFIIAPPYFTHSMRSIKDKFIISGHSFHIKGLEATKYLVTMRTLNRPCSFHIILMPKSVTNSSCRRVFWRKKQSQKLLKIGKQIYRCRW